MCRTYFSFMNLKQQKIKNNSIFFHLLFFSDSSNNKKVFQQLLIFEASSSTSWRRSSASSPSASPRRECPGRCRPSDPCWACRTSRSGTTASAERYSARQRSSPERAACGRPRRNWGRASRPLPEEGSWKEGRDSQVKNNATVVKWMTQRSWVQYQLLTLLLIT